MTGLTRALAAYVSHPIFNNQEQAACEAAKTGLIDTVSTMLAGHNEPIVRILLEHYQSFTGPSEAPIPFVSLMRPAAQAAMINGTAAHALDYDDVALSGHPSTAIVPAILAEGHLLNASGRDVLLAYVVGYEVWAELFERESDKYHIKGWHPTGVFGAVAAAAAVAYLHRLNTDQAQAALAIAASMASGLVANFGTMTKPFHAGRAASHGIEAVRLAKLGMTAAADAFEHPAGFLNAISPAGKVDRERAATSLGGTPRILVTGLSIKRYPVCYSCHRTIDGVLEIVERENLQPEQIKKVSLTIGTAQASMLRNHHPKTGLEAKFSAEFAVASAVVARAVGLGQLTDEFATRSDVSDLYGKVSIGITDSICPLDPSFSFFDQVVIELNDGRVFDSGPIRFPLGNAMNPLNAEGLRAKFMECLAIFNKESNSIKFESEGLFERLRQLETLPNIQSLFT